MSHTYTTSTNVAVLLGTSFSASTAPTDTQVAAIISRVGDFVSKYSGHQWTLATATEYFDVLDEYRLSSSGYGMGIYGHYNRPSYGLGMENVQTVFHLKNHPIVGIGTLQENIAGTSSQNWSTRASGYGGDFLIYNQQGYVEFIKNYPAPGYKNLRVLYTYGEATVPNDIAYAIEILVAEEILNVQMQGQQLSSITVGGTSYTWQSTKEMRAKAFAILDQRGRDITAILR